MSESELQAQRQQVGAVVRSAAMGVAIARERLQAAIAVLDRARKLRVLSGRTAVLAPSSRIDP
ncbi:MAG: hypothetical protein JWQ33_2440 [Ramlibacter sp.]|nr:hypothetical protein [Ramlibacter sp.]